VGGRILAATASVSAALVLTTAMARTDPQAEATIEPDAAAVQPAPIVVRIVVSAAPAVDAPPAASVATAPSPVAAAVPAPVAAAPATTRSRGS
jgi:hypothetical protein